jgi:CubicO group peptidase (beta-lactamase class C family)
VRAHHGRAALALGLAASIVGAAAASERAADPTALAAALDGDVPAEMSRRHLPGAVVVVADRDGAILARGFGVASLARGDPIDPAWTTFRIASVSKLFTATAVVQLHERGRVSLDADVNTYLRRFRVPATFPEPITLRQLLTHSAGLAERFLGHRARTRGEQIPLGEYLARRLPPRFAPPGRFSSYANHGMALAGFVVAEVSGKPFPRYVAEEVLAPLGMTSTSFEMEDALAARLATGYVFAGGSFHPVAVDFRHETPSGSLVTTGADMARFVAAQLRGGELDGARILAPESVAAMHARQFGHHPKLGGIGLGFMERRVRGLRAVGHDGDIVGWSARLLLLPERGLGLFLGHTGVDTAHRFAEVVTEAVLAAAGVEPVGEDATAARGPAPAEELARVAGSYRWTRGPRAGMERLVVPYPWAEYRVRAAADGRLELAAPLGIDPPRRFAWVEPLFYREIDGAGRLAFGADAQGRIGQLFLDPGLPMALERIGCFESMPVQAGLLLGCLALFGAGGAALAARLLRDAPARRSAAACAAFATCAAYGIFLAAFPLALGLGAFPSDVVALPTWLATPGNPAFYYGVPTAAAALLVLPPVGLAGSVLLAVLTARAFRRGAWSGRARLVAAGLAAAGLGCGALLARWDLLGYHP